MVVLSMNPLVGMNLTFEASRLEDVKSLVENCGLHIKEMADLGEINGKRLLRLHDIQGKGKDLSVLVKSLEEYEWDHPEKIWISFFPKKKKVRNRKPPVESTEPAQ